MKKEIDLFKLQTIVDEPAMQNIDRFRCRSCNKPFLSLIDAYSCDCKIIRGKKVFWPSNSSKKKKPMNVFR
jgi:hypothetical protein